MRAVRGRCESRLPVPLHGHDAAGDRHRMPGGQLANLLEDRSRRERDPEGEDLIERDRIDLARHAGQRQDGLDLGREGKLSARGAVEQGTHAQPIPRQKQRAGPRVPDGERPLAVEMADARLAVLFVRVEDDLRVRPGGELVTAPDELLAQLDVVENLAVERDPERLVFVRHRLVSAGQIENAQSCVAQPHARVRVVADAVGPAVPQPLDHPPWQAGIDGLTGEVQNACNTAHIRCPSL